MRKFFLIPVLALFTCVSAWAGNVSNLAELQAALAAGGDITLTADINAGASALTVNKGITLNGNGHYVKTTDTYVFVVTTSETVKFEDVVIYGAKTNAGRGIHIKVSNANVALDKVTINAQIRGIDVFVSGGVLDNVTLDVKNSTIQHVCSQYGFSIAEDGTPSDPTVYNVKTEAINSDYSRGINLGRLTNSSFTLDNSTVQGFFYNVNVLNGTMAGTNIIVSNSTFKGRDALNMHGQGATSVFTDCWVRGINNFGSSQESFACFVLDSYSNNCSLTINGGTTVSTVFDEVGGSNPNATEYLLACRGTQNTIVVNNSQYTCDRSLGSTKGGLVEYLSSNNSITFNDGIYNCPQILFGFFYTDNTHITINGGTYSIDSVASVYSYVSAGHLYYDYPMFDVKSSGAISLTGGTYSISMEKVPVAYPGLIGDSISLIADGYKQLENANGTYSIVPDTIKTQGTKVNDVNWNTPSHWSTTSQAGETVPDSTTSVTIGNGTDEVSVVVADDGDAEVYRVDLNDKVTLTVQDGGVLTVGEGGIVAHENAEVVVEEGGSLILNGLIQGTENIVIEASEDNSAAVLIDPSVNTYGDEHPVGTFRFTSKSYKNGDKVVHQRFGMPTYNEDVAIKYATASTAATYITYWDYENDEWKHDGDVIEWTLVPSTGTLDLTTASSFTCYDLISNNAKGAEITYEFKGALMGNADAAMSFNRGFNPYANSYTAPINIASFLKRIDEEYAGTDIHPTIYLYKALANDNYTWITIGLDEAIFGDDEYKEIAPMQAFMMYLGSNTPQTASIDYEGNVFDPFMEKLNGGSGSGAPKRRVAANKNYMSMTIVDAEGLEYDRVKLIEDNRFSAEFDKGFDAMKFMKEDVCLYASADEAQATLASDDVENMYIGVKVAQSGVYTLNIKHNGLDYALVDLENNNVIELTAGNTYNFFQEAGQNDARFQVVKVNKVPTAIDEVENGQVLSTKVLKNGALYILKNGEVYNAQGQIVK